MMASPCSNVFRCWPILSRPGKYVMEDVHKIGGVPAVLKYLLAKG
jgi:dihydroxyacid dehydratase/phosphogluconate dehydratase